MIEEDTERNCLKSGIDWMLESLCLVPWLSITGTVCLTVLYVLTVKR